MAYQTKWTDHSGSNDGLRPKSQRTSGWHGLAVHYQADQADKHLRSLRIPSVNRKIQLFHFDTARSAVSFVYSTGSWRDGLGMWIAQATAYITLRDFIELGHHRYLLILLAYCPY